MDPIRLEHEAAQTAAEAALNQWTGRTYLRKSRGRKICAHWLAGEKCSGRIVRLAGWVWECRPPRADHLSGWGFGPRLGAFRVACSQPYGVDTDAQALEADQWARAWGLAVVEWADRSWHLPGSTTLHVFVSDILARGMARRDGCPACGIADARWAERACCWTAEILGAWEARSFADVLMGEA